MPLTDEDRALIESVTGTRIDEHVKVLMCTVEDLAALLSAARTQSQGEGWEPIETAPRDGTSIILFCPQGDGSSGSTYRVTEGFWLSEPGGTTEYRDQWGRYEGQTDDPGFDGWVSMDGGFSESTMMPTHWRPLPAPPASQTQPRETPADPDHMNLRGTCEDPRLKQAGYIVCGSNADREWHWKPPGGAWRDGHRSEEAAVNAALKHLAASQTQEG